MILLLADEHFPHSIVVATRALDSQVDFLTVQGAGLVGTSDPELLEWAAAQNRVIVGCDVNTMIGFAYERIRRGQPMPGLVIGFLTLPNRLVAEDLATIGVAGLSEDYRDRVVYLPL